MTSRLPALRATFPQDFPAFRATLIRGIRHAMRCTDSDPETGRVFVPLAPSDPSGRTAQREQGSTSRRTKALASTFAALASVNDARRTLPAAEMMPGFTALLTLASIFCFASDFKLRNFI